MTTRETERVDANLLLSARFTARFHSVVLKGINKEEKTRVRNMDLTLETTMMGTMDAWKSHSSCIGASGLSRSARPAEKQARKESAATALPPDLAFLPISHRGRMAGRQQKRKRQGENDTEHKVKQQQLLSSW